MSTARQLSLLSVEEYLSRELTSLNKHEYLGGVVYAMAGASNAHNLIASNTLIALGSRLRGTLCRAYNSDTKIRIRLPNHVRFYYPDLSVVCRPNPQGDSFQDEPTIVVEVLSSRTRRLDEGEKKEAYLSIPSLLTYLQIEQDAPAVIAFRRTDQGFVRQVLQGLDAALPLAGISPDVSLAEIYEGVDFPPQGYEETAQ